MRSPKTHQPKVNLEAADSLGAFCAYDAFVLRQPPALWDVWRLSLPSHLWVCYFPSFLQALTLWSSSCSSLEKGARPGSNWIAVCPDWSGDWAAFSPRPVSCSASFPGCRCLPWKLWIAQPVGEILSGPYGRLILLKKGHRHMAFSSGTWHRLQGSFLLT